MTKFFGNRAGVVNVADINAAVTALGREIFKDLGQEQPSAFNKNFWIGRIMEWSLARPDFKINMFRLVDVLPSLSTSRAIASHVREYLSRPARGIHGLVEWGVNSRPNSIRGLATSFLVKRSVKQMAALFIAGENPHGALPALKKLRQNSLAFTVDLLGEFSVSEQEAGAYLRRYLEALDVLGSAVPRWTESAPIIPRHPGELSPVCISIKLTALYSQCNVLNFERSCEVLSERLAEIVRRAKKYQALIYVDAEDFGNNSIIYEVFKRVFGAQEFCAFPYPGIVLQAYARDSKKTLLDLIDFARKRGAPIAVRLVKGAYWDYETIISQQNNWPSPLFASKESTDAHYEELARILIDHCAHCLPAFGSHNIRSLTYACCYAEMAGLRPEEFEVEMLYGMAEPIARAFARRGYLVRLYVPLGEMLPGMGYLVRRLLENTSNESFLKHTFYDASDIDKLLAEPKFGEEPSV